MLFARADTFSPLWLKQKLSEFSGVSGLQPNLLKSQVFIAGDDEDVRNQIVQQLQITPGTLPIRYLGVPLISTKLSYSNCLPILDSIKQRISIWMNRFLTFAGRVQLINSVLFHIQTYWSSIFILPRKVVKEIEKLYRNFLWAGRYEKNGMALVAWRDVCLPRNEGGLGVKQIKQWNRAAMVKHLWRLHANVPDLWVY